MNSNPNWILDSYGNKGKGTKEDEEPTYCPSCNMHTFKSGYLIKIKKGLFFETKKSIGVVTHRQAYSKGYKDKKGNHYCGKCNHILSVSLGKWKETKKDKMRREKSIEDFNSEHSCFKCRKYVYGYENYEVGQKYYCVPCFKEFMKRNDLSIEWWYQ